MEPRAYPPNFLKILEASYVKENDEKKLKDRPFHHNPSSASFRKSDGSVVGACLRALYFRAKKEPESDPKSATTYLQADFGNGIHSVVLERLARSKEFTLKEEAPAKVVVDGLTNEVSLRLDGLVTYRGELGGLEIKTKQTYAVQKYLRAGEPDESHLLQVLSYFGTNPDLRWFSLVYLARDTAYRGEFHVYKNPETGQFLLESVTPKVAAKPIKELSFSGIVERWKELETAIETERIPARDFSAVLDKEGNLTDKRTKNYVEYKTDFHCMYCSWKTTCWKMPGKEQDSVKIPG